MFDIVVDHDLCQGHGRCNATAPQLFPIDEDGYAVGSSGLDGDEALARRGADACPEQAITIVSHS